MSIASRCALAGIVLAAAASFATAQTIEIYAGGNFFKDDPGTSVQVSPHVLAGGPDGMLYIGDSNGRLLRLDPAQGTITALPGIAGHANFDVGTPYGMAFDPAGQLFVTTEWDLYRIDIAAGATPYVGPMGYAGPMVYGADGALYYVSNEDHRVRKRLPSGQVTVIANEDGIEGFDGDGGPAVLAHLDMPMGIARDAAGNLYVADTQNQRVRRIDAATGIITTIAGTGTWGYNGDNHTGPETNIGYPMSLAFDSSGNLYIATDSSRILRLDATSGLVTVFAGNGQYGFSGDGGPAVAAQLSVPDSIAFDAAGNLYLDDQYRVRKVAAGTGIITTVAGNGEYIFCGEDVPARKACLSHAWGLDIDAAQNLVFTGEALNRVRQVSAASGNVSTLVLLPPNVSGMGVEHDAAGNEYVASWATNRVYRIDAVTHALSVFAGVGGWASYSGNGGPATIAGLDVPSDIAFDAAGNAYISDTGSHHIRKVDAATGIINNYAGNFSTTGPTGDGGPATAASLSSPFAIDFDPAGNLVISDGNHCRLRRIDYATGIISTIAGNGTCTSSAVGDGGLATAASIGSYPAFAFDPAGNIFVAYSNQLRRIDAKTGIINSIPPPPGGWKTADGASLQEPWTMEFDSQGRLYVGDRMESVIFRISGLPYEKPDATPPVIEPHIAGTAGTNGWYTSDVSLTWSVTDAESPVTSSEGCDAAAVTQDTDGVTFRCAATSAGGMAEKVVTLRRDATPPTLTFGTPSPAPVNGWNKTNVSIPFTYGDALSGIASVSTSSPLVLSTEGEGVTGQVIVTDVAGNSVAFTSVPRNIDKNPPVITLTTPADGVTYGFYQDVRANYVCADVTLVSCSGTTANGELLNTRTAGARTFKVTGKDRMNFTSSVTHSYTVASTFNFDGFLAPMSAPPTLNVVPRGSLVPIHWRLPDGNGGFVSDPASFSSINVVSLNCGTTPAVPLGESAQGPAGLSFDAATGTFTLNWQTDASWTPCGKLTIRLRDNSLHELRFRFQ